MCKCSKECQSVSELESIRDRVCLRDEYRTITAYNVVARSFVRVGKVEGALESSRSTKTGKGALV